MAPHTVTTSRGLHRTPSLAQPESPSSLLSVGLCFSALNFRFFSAGSVRVGGGVPIAWRAAAFTADAARNGFGLRLFAAMLPPNACRLVGSTDSERVRNWLPEINLEYNSQSQPSLKIHCACERKHRFRVRHQAGTCSGRSPKRSATPARGNLRRSRCL